MTRLSFLVAAVLALALLIRVRREDRPHLDRDVDEMCPNCVTPWKCNGPHLDRDAWPEQVMERNRDIPLGLGA